MPDMQSINGAYYGSDGTIKNMDGGTGNGAPDMAVRNGNFIGSDGQIHNLDEVFNRDTGGSGNVEDGEGNTIVLNNVDVLSKINIDSNGLLTFDGSPIKSVIGNM